LVEAKGFPRGHGDFESDFSSMIDNLARNIQDFSPQGGWVTCQSN